MDKYHLQLTIRTKILNIFRRFFTWSPVEQILLRLYLKKNSPFLEKLIPPNYLYKSPSIRTAKRKGIVFKLDISDVMDHFIYWGYRDQNYRSIVDVIMNANVLVDIGANIGDTALYYASINPMSKVFAFEPHPLVFKKSVENVALNNFSNIQLMNIGLGENCGTFKLYEVNENNAAMNRILAEEKNLPYQEIKVETLDHVAVENGIGKVDFIKLDVEGFEHAVLLGGKNIISQSKPVLFIELDDSNLNENNSSAKELIRTLYSFGYQDIYRADNLAPLTIDQDFSNCHYDIIAR
jgi:FkbM family methyltransferase